MRRLLILVAALLVLTAPAFAQQPAPPTPPQAAQDGFVPVDAPMGQEDTMPAPRLVAIGYGLIWVVFFGYLVSIKTRLSKVEREMEAVSRRAGTGGRPA